METKNRNDKKEITINELAGTIDNLAGMMQRGFVALENKMDGKFEIVDNKFDQIDRKFDQIDNKFDQVDEKFDQIDEKFRRSLDNQDKIMNSLVNLETDNTAGARASRRQEDKLEDHEERIVVVEGNLGIRAVG